MQILAIGNSFSQDATANLKKIADAAKEDITVVNLVIGGCSLSRHYRNMLSEERVYSMEFNGVATGFNVSLKEALLSRDWDVITIQQASHFSTKAESYQPYLSELAAYLRKYCPKVRLVIHETWAYEQGSPRLNDYMKYSDCTDMYNDIHAAYSKAAKEVDAYKIIPSGTLIQRLYERGITKLHRDSFHLSYGVGRYATALLWFRCLTGRSVLDNGYKSYSPDITDEDYTAIKELVEELG